VLLSVNSAWSIEESWENMKLDTCFIPYPKINSSWIRDINVKDAKNKALKSKHRIKRPWLRVGKKISDTEHKTKFEQETRRYDCSFPSNLTFIFEC